MSKTETNNRLEEFRKERKEKKQENLKNLLKNIGFILATISGIAYLIIVYILIAGFENKVESDKLLIFLILGAIAGVSISMSLRIQGINYAKDLDYSKKILKEYTDLLPNNKKIKLRSINFRLMMGLIKDVITKGITTVVSLYFAIEIILTGIHDFKYFYLAVSNLFMWIGFGFLALAKSYDRYIEEHIPYLIKKIKESDLNESDQRNVKETHRIIGESNGDKVFIKSDQIIGNEGTGNGSVKEESSGLGNQAQRTEIGLHRDSKASPSG